MNSKEAYICVLVSKSPLSISFNVRTFRYVPKIAEVRGQGVGNFPLNYTDEKGEARLMKRGGTGTASTSNQIHQISVL